MALQTLWSGLFPSAYGATGDTSLSMALADDKVAFVVRLAKSGNIRKVHFLLGSVTTGQTLKVALQNVNASGDPDDTDDQSGTVTVADTDDGLWKTVTLGTDRASTAGDAIGVVIKWNGSAGNLNIICADTIIKGNIYPDRFTVATWTKQLRAPCVVLEYDDATIAPLAGVLPGSSTSTDFGSGDTPDEVALILNYPFPCQCSGGEFFGRLTGDAQMVLYDSDGTTVLGSMSLDKDENASGTDSVWAFSWAPTTLLANTTYRLALKPTSATAVRLRYLVTGTAAHLDTMEGGDGFHWSQRTDAGAWTQTTTRRPYFGARLEAFDAGGGGGGGLKLAGRGGLAG